MANTQYWTPERIRLLMRVAGHSRPSHLAAEIGVTRQTVNNWLAGRRHPWPSMVDRLEQLRDRHLQPFRDE